MAAVTGTIIALGGLGISVAQAIKQNKAMKEADSVSQKASKYIKGITEQNAFKQTQVPTLGTQLAQQSQAQREAQAVNMLQGAGAEGVIGGVGQLAVAGEQSDLQNAARLDELKFERDAMQAQAQQGINARKQEREFEVGMGEKQDAEMRRAQAEANRNAAIENAVGFAGSAISSLSKMAPLYGKKTAPSDGPSALDDLDLLQKKKNINKDLHYDNLLSQIQNDVPFGLQVPENAFGSLKY